MNIEKVAKYLNKKADNLKSAVDNIVDKLNKLYGKEIAGTKNYYEVQDLKAYYRIVTKYATQTSAYAFIAKADGETRGLGVIKAGDIFKPAGWSAPSKTARGNVFDLNDSNFQKTFGEYSVAYLRGGM